MANRRVSVGQPRQWIAEGEWPTGRFKADAPEEVAHILAISLALKAAIEGRGQTRAQVAAAAGINETTLYGILSGKAVPDTLTLAKLEEVLDHALWPHTPPPPLQRARPETDAAG